MNIVFAMGRLCTTQVQIGEAIPPNHVIEIPQQASQMSPQLKHLPVPIPGKKVEYSALFNLYAEATVRELSLIKIIDPCGEIK